MMMMMMMMMMMIMVNTAVCNTCTEWVSNFPTDEAKGHTNAVLQRTLKLGLWLSFCSSHD